jgi:hypothetical protein
MNAEQIVSLLTEFAQPAPDESRFSAIQEKLNEIRSDSSYLPVALELLTGYQEASVVWFACCIIQNLIIFDWVPRSMTPDPTCSPIPPATKQEIRTFFVTYLNDRIDRLPRHVANFVYHVIVTSMKVDFQNEGAFWLSFAQENLQIAEKRHTALILIRFLSDELQSLSDHTIPSSVRITLRQSFLAIVPDVTKHVVELLSSSLDATEPPSDIAIPEAFLLFKSFLHWISPECFSVEFVQIILMYSRFSMGGISLQVHQCIFSLFTRIDVVSVHSLGFRAQLLQIVIEFFENEMKLFMTPDCPAEFTKSLLHAFQPFAANYFFKQDDFNSLIVVRFLEEFEEWTWAMFGTPNFTSMLEIWSDLLHGSRSAYVDEMRYRAPFVQFVEHILESMITPERIQYFTKDDFVLANDFINEAASSDADDSLYRLVQRATATAVNANLPSVAPMLTCFFHVIYYIPDEDPANESISDSLLKYANEMMTKDLPIDVAEVFPLVQSIIKNYLRKFARKSFRFVDKVFHLVTVAIGASPDFLEPMMELLLETLKIDRPQNPCKGILARLYDMHDVFTEMKIEIYSLYLQCCETIAAYSPTDGGNLPLGTTEDLKRIFWFAFELLRIPEKQAGALCLLRDAVNNILFSARNTKELVFRSLEPYIEPIMAIYESPASDAVMGAVLDFVASFCTIFLTQIADRMSEFVNRLFAPLASLLPGLDQGSFEHFATMSFLRILFQLTSFRSSSASDLQAVNTAEFLLGYSQDLLHGESVEVVRLTLSIVKLLITDRWQCLSSEVQMELLKMLFFEGICIGDPDSVKTSIDALVFAHTFYSVLDLVELEFRFHSFSAICGELVQCGNTMMRDSLVNFAVFFCGSAPDFYESLLVPFINELPVSPAESAILVAEFESFQNEREFQKIFIDFCDDVAYLLAKR